MLTQDFWYPHLLPKGGGRPDPLLSQTPLPHERELLWGMRDTFERL